MANFNFTVDTQDMAHSLHGVAPHVDGTTAAVVAMQTAVVIAEKKAAEKICENVNRGFFGLIRSQLTQKLAGCKSQMDARIMEMTQQFRNLGRIRLQMGKDFHMIAARYTKLFRSLDASLQAQINELDKPLFTFASKEMELTRNRARCAQATVPIHQSESVNTTQQLAVSQAKASTVRALEGMRRFVAEANLQKAIVSRMLAEAAEGGDSTLFVPVLFMEADNTRTQQKQWHFHYPGLPEPVRNAIAGTVEEEVLGTGSTLGWAAPPAEDRTRINKLFLEWAQSGQVGERTRALMIQLFNGSKWHGPHQGVS